MESLRNFQKGGAANGGPDTREFNWNYSYHNNPFWVMEDNPQLDDRDRLIGSVSVNYQLADGLNAMVRTGSDIYRLGVQQLYARGAEEFINLTYNGGFRFVNDYRNDNNTDLTVTGNRQLASWLQLNAVAGGNIRREYFNGNSQQTTGLVVPGFTTRPTRRSHPLSTKTSCVGRCREYMDLPPSRSRTGGR